MKALYYMQGSKTLKAVIISKAIQDLKAYFGKFNSYMTQEAMSRAFEVAIVNYDTSREIIPYIKKLARTVMLNEAQDVPTENCSELAVDVKTQSVEEQALTSTICNDIYCLIIKEVLLPHMSEFLKLGRLFNSKIQREECSLSSPFKTTCADIMNKTESKYFMSEFKRAYNDYGALVNWFLGQAKFFENNYKEVEYDMSGSRVYVKNTSKRLSLVGETGVQVKDADKHKGKIYVKGIRGGKKLFKVNYRLLLNDIKFLINSTVTNELVFVIGKNRIVRTCGGSLSNVNPNIKNIEKLLLDELVFNIALISNCKIIGIGSEYVYLMEGLYTKGNTISMKGVIGIGDITLDMIEVDIEEYGSNIKGEEVKYG